MIIATAVLLAAAVPVPVGVGSGAWPACLSYPAQPGHSYALTEGGQFSDRGIDFLDTGDSAETLVLSAAPLLPGVRLPGALPVPASWISFPQQQAAVQAGQDAWLPARLSVPAGARPGAYAAEIIASAAHGPAAPGTAQTGASAAVLTVFTVGVARPPASWDRLTDPCWAPLPSDALGYLAIASHPRSPAQPRAATYILTPPAARSDRRGFIYGVTAIAAGLLLILRRITR